MMREQSRFPRFALALALSCACASLAFAADPKHSGAMGAGTIPTRRFALVMGVNTGGPGTQRLRFATSDARSMAALLTELGGVRDEDLILLIEPGLGSFKSSADKLRNASAAATATGQRCEFIFYYSGHSDETGLLLGRDKLGYSQLRAAIEAVPAAVKVAILDSCSSGSLTRAKGGVMKPAFLFDASSDMEGHAYITSSSEAEAAQESDSIGGSFFTHYFVSALRGAADLRGAGKVTINDAYAYAYRETLASTEETKYGPQHAAYEINLTGTGDLVLTDLRTARAILAFGPDVGGSLFVRDSRGSLAAELEKSPGERMEMGLSPGNYSVVLVKGEARSQAEASIASGGKAVLAAADFKATAAAPTRARGAEQGGRTFEVAGQPFYFDLSLMPDFSRGLYSSETDRSIAIGLLWSSARDIGAIQISTLGNFDSGSTRGFQVAGVCNAVAGDSGGFQYSAFVNSVGGDFRGFQWSGAVNAAGGRVTGAQMGLVNVAGEITGTQIGLVNVSKRIRGFPIGLVNIESGGILGVQAWWDSSNSARAAFQFGTRSVYTILTAGLGLDEGGDPFTLGLGYGARLGLGPFCIDGDLSWRSGFGAYGYLPSIEARFLAAFPSGKAGLIAGLELEGYLPGLSRNDAGTRYGSFVVEPRFMVGVKL